MLTMAREGCKPPVIIPSGLGTHWGMMGHWLEMYDEVSAKTTINKLSKHWQHAPNSSAKKRRASSQSLEIVSASESEDGETNDLQNQVCTHVACSQISGCIIDHMEVVKHHYQGKTDQFKIKAIDRAIRQFNVIPNGIAPVVRSLQMTMQLLLLEFCTIMET